MHRSKQIDLQSVKTYPIKIKSRKVKVKDFAEVYSPKQRFSEFVRSFPHILVSEDLRSLVNDIAKAHTQKKPIIMMMGAHVVKVGLSPLIIDLLKKKLITCLVMNGAAAIHDVEIAMWGTTSEDVEENIRDGSFGMSRETGEFINNTLMQRCIEGTAGYGEVIGEALQKSPNKKLSLLAACYSYGVPVTIHVAIGTDIIHQQPTMDGAITG
ncbi:MAG: hypothetical protein HY800_01290, partial [Ignavibacteriales bacterium]|nr:hypothetical protein [Ignavibacteriales bacterium]